MRFMQNPADFDREFEEKLKKATADFAALPIEQQEEILRKQRESWARQDLD